MLIEHNNDLIPVRFGSLLPGELYHELGGSLEHLFIVTDENTVVYLSNGCQCDLTEFDENPNARFVKVNAKLVVE